MPVSPDIREPALLQQRINCRQPAAEGFVGFSRLA
jgi:hypothetical protein